MSEYVYAGLTSQTIDIFLADSSSTTGAGLAGLVYNTSGLTCYYRKGATGTSTAITLATQTVGGSWSSGGFVEVDSTNMPGVYRLDIPDTVVSAEGYVTIYFQGAANLAPRPFRIDCSPVPADVRKISEDSTAADNLELQYDTTGLTGDTFPATQLQTKTSGYDLGAIWIDTGASNTNTTDYVDGTADNPVSTWAAALTLSASLGIERFHIGNGSSITLTANSDNYTLTGINWTLALGGQSVSGAVVDGATVTGNDGGLNTVATLYKNCTMGTNTLGLHELSQCGLSGTITIAEAGTYDWISCYSRVAGISAPIIDVGATSFTTDLNMRNYSGGIELANFGIAFFAGLDKMSLEGNGQLIIGATCVDGDIALRGNFKVTDNSGGAVTIVADDNTTNIDAVKTKTDQLSFGVSNQVDVNVESINTSTVNGAGTSGYKWRGA